MGRSWKASYAGLSLLVYFVLIIMVGGKLARIQSLSTAPEPPSRIHPAPTFVHLGVSFVHGRGGFSQKPSSSYAKSGHLCWAGLCAVAHQGPTEQWLSTPLSTGTPRSATSFPSPGSWVLSPKCVRENLTLAAQRRGNLGGRWIRGERRERQMREAHSTSVWQIQFLMA